MITSLAVIAFTVGVCVGSDPPASYGKEVVYKKTYTYYGKFPGKCGNDGLYYKDKGSFVYCSNGNSYEQPCSPGTENSAYENYSYGGTYGYRDFCDINLVDLGYGAPPHAAPAADPYRPAYGSDYVPYVHGDYRFYRGHPAIPFGYGGYHLGPNYHFDGRRPDGFYGYPY